MPPKNNLGTCFPAGRVKKIMQVDEEVGKLANSVPLVVGKACELFLDEIMCAIVSMKSDSAVFTKLEAIDVKNVIINSQKYAFLHDIVRDIVHVEQQQQQQESKSNLNSPTISGTKSGGKRKRFADFEDNAVKSQDDESKSTSQRSTKQKKMQRLSGQASYSIEERRSADQRSIIGHALKNVLRSVSEVEDGVLRVQSPLAPTGSRMFQRGSSVFSNSGDGQLSTLRSPLKDNLDLPPINSFSNQQSQSVQLPKMSEIIQQTDNVAASSELPVVHEQLQQPQQQQSKSMESPKKSVLKIDDNYDDY
ncbi:hypothetical protein MP228_007109 [Amoeboaphelidium protococcarum]|nr:hypothetical protein MP228_007109 [Amoeboaphelidium protococcarum]